ncbi:MAG: hypothetical protein AB8I08_08965 [Sandaracinaceae bacterium]
MARADTLYILFKGYVREDTVEFAVNECRNLLLREVRRYLVIDCCDIDGYSADVRGPGVNLLKVTRGLGVLAGVCVAPTSAVRMMGAAAAFVSGVPIDFVASRIECDAALAKRRREDG